MQNENRDENEIQINIVEIISMLLKRVWLIVICAAIVGTAMYFYSTYRIEPVYATSLKLIVNTPSNNSDTNQDSYTPVNTSNKIINNYIQVLDTADFYGRLSQEVDERYTADELKEMISISQQQDTTAIIRVTVRGHNASDIYKIAVAFSKKCADDYDTYIKEGAVKVLEEPIEPTEPVAPNVQKYTIISAIIAAIVCSFIIILMYCLDNRIKSAQELGDRYDIPVLGEIPDILGNYKGAKYSYGEKK